MGESELVCGPWSLNAVRMSCSSAPYVTVATAIAVRVSGASDGYILAVSSGGAPFSWK
jgi:hypothetical protein